MKKIVIYSIIIVVIVITTLFTVNCCNNKNIFNKNERIRPIPDSILYGFLKGKLFVLLKEIE